MPPAKWRARESTQSPMVSQVPCRTTQLLVVQIFTVSARTAPSRSAPTTSVARTHR